MASSLTNAQKKEWAKSLFLHENITQKEISERVGVSSVTVNKWVKGENWDGMKVSLTITREEQLKNLYNQLKEINKAISERTERKYATAAEADTISKLANAIEKMESDIGIAEMIGTLKKLTEWIRKVDLEKAKELLPLFDAFINANLT